MAWLYQRPDSKKWWIGFRKNGRQVLLSTKTDDRKKAEARLREFQLLEDAEKAGRLTEEFVAALTGRRDSVVSFSSAVADFLNETRGSTAKTTLERYESIISKFKVHIKATDAKPLLRELSSSDVRSYLAAQRARTSASTTNLEKKILSSFFEWCIANHLLKENPVTPLKSFKESADEEFQRRAFTLDELRTLFRKAPNGFWRYMIANGFYSGLRLGDLVTLRAGELDFAESLIRRTTGKRNKLVLVPIYPQVRPMLEQLAKGKKPNEYLWPKEAKRYQEHRAKVFSNEFYSDVLVPSGLTVERSYKETKVGRAGRRKAVGVSFHSLRHSFVSFLKATGSNSAVARELAGHGSDAVNNLYTHLPEQTLRDAINKLPEVTK